MPFTLISLQIYSQKLRKVFVNVLMFRTQWIQRQGHTMLPYTFGGRAGSPGLIAKRTMIFLAVAIMAVLPHPKDFQCPTLLPVAPLNCHTKLININEHSMWDPTNAKGGSTIPEGIGSMLHLLWLCLICLNRRDLLGDILLLQMLGYGLVGVHLPLLIVEVRCNLATGSVGMGKEEDHKINHVRMNNIRTHSIAGAMIWDDAVGPPIKGQKGSFGLLPHIPSLQLRLPALYGVSGGAFPVGMRCHVPRLR